MKDVNYVSGIVHARLLISPPSPVSLFYFFRRDRRLEQMRPPPVIMNRLKQPQGKSGGLPTPLFSKHVDGKWPRCPMPFRFVFPTQPNPIQLLVLGSEKPVRPYVGT